MICVGSKNEDKYAGSCKGDSGGPLTWEDKKTSKWNLVGVVSFENTNTLSSEDIWGNTTELGIECTEEGIPSVYAKVTSAMPWIKNVVDGKEEPTPSDKIWQTPNPDRNTSNS